YCKIASGYKTEYTRKNTTINQQRIKTTAKEKPSPNKRDKELRRLIGNLEIIYHLDTSSYEGINLMIFKLMMINFNVYF
ncbi:8335_t:CDS:2, partial [Funneliformis caledonium]